MVHEGGEVRPHRGQVAAVGEPWVGRRELPSTNTYPVPAAPSAGEAATP